MPNNLPNFDLKLQPTSKEAEEAVLAEILSEPILIEKVMGWIIGQESFYYKINQQIWTIMVQLHKDKEKIDVITILNRYRDLPKDEKRDDPSYYLTGLYNSAGFPSHIEAYARIIRERFVQREVAKSAGRLEKRAWNSYEEMDTELRTHRVLLDELQQLQPSKQQSVDSVMDETKESLQSQNNIIPFGLPVLDKRANGMTRKEITVVGGRPGHGKTTLVLNCVKSLVEGGFSIMLFNREMSNIEFMKKLIVLESSRIDYGHIRKSQLMDYEAKELIEVEARIRDKYRDNFIMYEDIRDIDTAIREVRKHSPDVVIDDYIQLIDVKGRKDARRFEIEYILNEYKWVAKEKNCSVLLVSQLSRDIEKRMDPTPRMSDYAESGVIEQICETALFVFYPHNFNSDEDKYESQIITAKSRYGEIGEPSSVGFNGKKCKFYNFVEEAKADKFAHKEETQDDI